MEYQYTHEKVTHTHTYAHTYSWGCEGRAILCYGEVDSLGPGGPGGPVGGDARPPLTGTLGGMCGGGGMPGPTWLVGGGPEGRESWVVECTGT